MIVRGNEATGPVIWEFGSTVAGKIDAYLASEDYGDLTDIVSGFDLTITGFEATMKDGKKYTDVTVTPRRKESPVSKDADTVQKWLDEQKDPAQVLYKTLAYDELKQMLKDYLTPGDEDEEDAPPAKKPAPLAPAKAPVKREVIPEPEETDDKDEGETPPPPPMKKPKASKAPVATEEEDDDFDNQTDELSDKIPTGKPKSTPVEKPKATKASAPVSQKKSFDSLWEDEEEEED